MLLGAGGAAWYGKEEKGHGLTGLHQLLCSLGMSPHPSPPL